MTDYVDAGEAVPHKTLSATKNQAPPINDVDYERIKNARNEPANWMGPGGTSVVAPGGLAAVSVSVQCCGYRTTAAYWWSSMRRAKPSLGL